MSSTIEWTIDAATAGVHDLNLRYANGSGETRSVQIQSLTTGETLTLDLPPTAGWSDLQYATASTPLTAGKHKFRLTSALATPVAIDFLMVSPPVA